MGVDTKPSKRTISPPQPSSQVLSTHPLLDARRTFLATLVLATKFIQDKAYSNKAWAKLSGLGGKEVGRCERVLRGALQWCLWVGKDIGKSSIRGRSPFADEVESLCSGEMESSIVHGEDDEVAKAFMAQVAEQERPARVKAGGDFSPAYPALERALPQAVEVARAGFGRARTWPLLNLAGAPSCCCQRLSCDVVVYPPTSQLRCVDCGSLADQMSSVNLQQPISSMGHGLPSSFDWHGVESGLLGGSGMLSMGILANIDLSTAPLQLGAVSNEEDFLETLLHNRTECPTIITTLATVRMAVDGQPEVKTPLATLNLTMVGALSSTNLSLPARSLQHLRLIPIHLCQRENVLHHSSAPDNPFLIVSPIHWSFAMHPQMAGSPSSGGSASSLLPPSASTFSSPRSSLRPTVMPAHFPSASPSIVLHQYLHRAPCLPTLGRCPPSIKAALLSDHHTLGTLVK